MTNKQLKKKIEEILVGFEREFDRCDGNYKYNRKPVINKLLSLCKEYALSVLPEEMKISNRWKDDVEGLYWNRATYFNRAIKQAKEKLGGE